MDWLNPENVIAVATALLGVLVSAAMLWYERRVPPRRKRIGHRVQLDTPIGSDARNGGRANVRLGLFDETPGMSDATLVLLRVENDGAQAITGDDYTARGPHGLTVEFADRTVRAIAVTQSPGADHLMEHFSAAGGLQHRDGTISLPRVPLNRGEHFKLLVLLTGAGVGSPVTVTGGIRDGKVRPNRAATPDEKPPLFSRAARAVTVALTACVITLATIIVREDPAPPMGCARGTLTVTGSTAFAPVVRELARKYEKDCPGATVRVDARGSTAGIRGLADAGAKSGKGSVAIIALSDGPKPGGYPQLRENRIAVSLFTLVVNDEVPVKNLTLADVRRLYRGEVTNWKQLEGPDLPVLLVSRDANSGTREVFQRRVLGRNEPAQSSRDCATKDDPEAAVVRCELDSTEQVLDTVARLPGALGYSEVRAGSDLPGLHRLAIDGRGPDVDRVGESGYPYRELEYAYTYGRPPADSLTSSFLSHLSRGSGQDVIRTHGHLPCMTPEGLRVCGAG
ncbi:phosphate ABC transporter substrate-binding protein [Streptomyces sp. WAC05374]|uniref:substrate-binding domain-containing protein n=1 Tax=Streptomyces sp. WAC05374 TaxID=2487420 RepID=UPI000F88173E|nr:substrate-binding domain-containing protein [Streptomyces sp. WAC05374]RST08563.1 phosphate ABC transporter substrate-binding protein [Streptomyces sp. WAC05374]TDF44796.1 phosphate ABC transporter substrate-binding protein [Streptomyces sp. WAC05374]TDF56036.1 phosphate ABC transporter substrate-binding protein [Streptomyces sp. WAC05374]TDF59791.1 phosphate ABC transporter substrate-binding protein [Streptomyces sp. WAC05374]